MEESLRELLSHFSIVQDPRSDRGKQHQLLDILVIAILAVLCGANDWTAVEEFGIAKETWLVGFLALPSGIPSHYTFRRVFARLDVEQFRQGFANWVAAAYELAVGQVIAIDGKTLRRSHDRYLGREAIQIVSAWASEAHLVLGQVKVDNKSNEIRAIPVLLEMLSLEGNIVTIDAIGCQREHARMIVEKEGDYVLAVKRNQKRLYSDLEDLFAEIDHPDIAFIEHDCFESTEKDHGRIETRRCTVLHDQDCLDYLQDTEEWIGVRSLVMVESQTVIGEKRSSQTRYYISSLPGNAKQILAAVRGHWSIENSLHWVLDIAFREDESRLRKDNSAESMAILRHLAINLLKRDRTTKAGVNTKRLRAGWDHDYLLSLLSLS